MSKPQVASQRPIRVAYCLDSFALGGTELNAVRTAESLDPNRFEIRVFHLQTHGPLRSRYERLGVPMEHLPIDNLYSPGTAAQGVRFASRLRRERVDVVHSHDIYCNIFAVPWARLLTPCSIIASRRWGRKASRPELATPNRWSSLLAHRVLANSRSVAELIVREEGMPPGKVVEVPNFLSDDAFDAQSPEAVAARRATWGVPEGAMAVGIVARLSPVKNHVLLLDAVQRLNERVHLVVVGDGALRTELEARARQLRIESRVHFAGEVIGGGNLHWFFDVSVLCSLSEGFPNTVIEAMAAGRPVVATPVGGVPDAITDDVSGILVPLDDPQPLAEALRRLQADPALRHRLGTAGERDARERYRQDAVIGKVTSLYETLATRRRAGPAEHPGD